MSSFNLIRNSKLYFTTNVAAATGVITEATAFTAANTQELQVLDGFSFSQASNADTITVSEAGETPTRGQRSFNTSLNNVEFSFSTYIRPNRPSAAPTLVKAEEACLWNALLANVAVSAAPSFTGTGVTGATLVGSALTIAGTGLVITGLNIGDAYVVKGVTGVGASQFNSAIKITALSATAIVGTYVQTPVATLVTGNWTAAVSLTKQAWNDYVALTADTTAPTVGGVAQAYSTVTSALSNKNQLLAFGVLVIVDGVTYMLDNCAMDSATIDFGLDGIATVAWVGKGTAIRQLATNLVATTVGSTGTFTGGATGGYTVKSTTAAYITNKLSTIALKKNLGYLTAGGTSYTLALTGGSIAIANNITYVTPANLGVVNIPIGYFTGTRAITGTITAYLRTGTANTSALLVDLLAAGSEPKYSMAINIGGNNATRVEVEISGALLQIPTIDAQAVMSTSIAFTAQGTDSVLSATAGYDLENTNDLLIRYLSPVTA